MCSDWSPQECDFVGTDQPVSMTGWAWFGTSLDASGSNRSKEVLDHVHTSDRPAPAKPDTGASLEASWQNAAKSAQREGGDPHPDLPRFWLFCKSKCWADSAKNLPRFVWFRWYCARQLWDSNTPGFGVPPPGNLLVLRRRQQFPDIGKLPTICPGSAQNPDAARTFMSKFCPESAQNLARPAPHCPGPHAIPDSRGGGGDPPLKSGNI
eukprot:gene9114-biopygen6181